MDGHIDNETKMLQISGGQAKHAVMLNLCVSGDDVACST